MGKIHGLIRLDIILVESKVISPEEDRRWRVYHLRVELTPDDVTAK